jgi:uncharacterized protein (TIGR00251 family)
MKLNIVVVPNSKTPEIIKINENNFKVRVNAPASSGEANKRLIEILADYFNVSKSSIKILKGFKNRNKIVCIEGP